MVSVRQGQQHIEQGDNGFPIDVKDGYLHITIVKYHHNF